MKISETWRRLVQTTTDLTKQLEMEMPSAKNERTHTVMID